MQGVPIFPRLVFNLTQSIEELEMFTELQKYLGVGRVYKNRKNVVFVVRSIDEIVNTILPLFDKHPLRGGKKLSYNIFKEVSLMVKDKKHLTVEGTHQIIELAYFMNKDTSLRTEESKKVLIEKLNLNNVSFPIVSKIPSIKALETPNNTAPISTEFIRGQIDGDGSFNVSFASTRRRIGVNFTVTHELASISVLNELVEFFQCGAVYKLPTLAARFQVQSVNDILNKVIPVFRDTRFNTKKQKHFEIVIKICELINKNGYSKNEDLLKIVELAWDMNKAKNRKISKEEYISKFINIK